MEEYNNVGQQIEEESLKQKEIRAQFKELEKKRRERKEKKVMTLCGQCNKAFIQGTGWCSFDPMAQSKKW